jgi:hypothetical protein
LATETRRQLASAAIVAKSRPRNRVEVAVDMADLPCEVGQVPLSLTDASEVGMALT